MCITAALGFGSALIGAGSARRAGRAQERAAQAQLDLSREQYNTTRADLAPFRDAGGNALAAYMYEMGLGPAPTFGGSAPEITTIPGTGVQAASSPLLTAISGIRGREGMRPINGDPSNGFERDPDYNRGTPTRYSVNGQMFDTMEQAQAFANANRTGGQAYGGISMSPGTRFALEEGRDTIEAGAAARGGLNSGATLAGLERLRFGLSAQDRETQLNRLGGLSEMGRAAAGMNAANSALFTQNAGNALGGIGNAQSAGAIGVGNALQSGLQNLSSQWGYMQSQPQTSNGWVSGPMTTSLRPQGRPA